MEDEIFPINTLRNFSERILNITINFHVQYHEDSFYIEPSWCEIFDSVVHNPKHLTKYIKFSSNGLRYSTILLAALTRIFKFGDKFAMDQFRENFCADTNIGVKVCGDHSYVTLGGKYNGQVEYKDVFEPEKFGFRKQQEWYYIN